MSENRSKPVKSITLDPKDVEYLESIAAEENLSFTGAIEKTIKITKVYLGDQDGYNISPEKYTDISLTSNIGRSGIFAKDTTIILAEILIELKKITAKLEKEE